MAKDVEITFGGDLSELKSRMDGVHSDVKSWGSKVAAIGVGAFAAWGATKVFDGLRRGLSALLGEMKLWIASATESSQIAAQLDAAIKSTGGSAGFTTKQLQDMASELQRVTIFEDDAINSAQTLLLRFKSIKGDNFKEVTELMLDMAAKTGDMEGSAGKLGRIMNDPIRAIRIMTKEGRALSLEQQQLIKDFVAVGEVGAAQRVVLEELSKGYAGSAEAATRAAGGGLKQLANQIDDIRKELGDKLLPIIDKFTPALKSLASEVGTAMAGLIDQVGKFGTAMTDSFGTSPAEKMVGAMAMLREEITLVWAKTVQWWDALLAVADIMAKLNPLVDAITDIEAARIDPRTLAKADAIVDELDPEGAARRAIDKFRAALAAESEAGLAAGLEAGFEQAADVHAGSLAAKTAAAVKKQMEEAMKSIGFATSILGSRQAEFVAPGKLGTAEKAQLDLITSFLKPFQGGDFLGLAAAAKKSGVVSKPEEGHRAQFEDAASMFRRIQSSAASLDPKERIAKDALDEQKKTKAASEETAKNTAIMAKMLVSGLTGQLATLGP